MPISIAAKKPSNTRSVLRKALFQKLGVLNQLDHLLQDGGGRRESGEIQGNANPNQA